MTSASRTCVAPAVTHHAAKIVCVMDASTPLGSALVGRLLLRGYAVHAATFGPGIINEAGWAENKRVVVFKSDPWDYHSISNAVQGCSGVFYTFDESYYDEFTVEVEVRAAHNVLEACAQSYTVEKVVFTSSVTAIIWKENRRMMEDMDERDWSDPNFCKKFKLWQALSKTLSEKTAWALAMDRGLDMVAVNAGLLVSGTKISQSSPYLRGTQEMYNDGVLVTADLKFLVDAHLSVFESQAAFGRYLCFNRAVCRPEDAAKLAQMLSPSVPSSPPRLHLESTDFLPSKIRQRIHNKKLSILMEESVDSLKGVEG